MSRGVGRIEKIVPTDMLVSIFDEPSNGSMAMLMGAAGYNISGSVASSDAKAAIGSGSRAARMLSALATAWA